MKATWSRTVGAIGFQVHLKISEADEIIYTTTRYVVKRKDASGKTRCRQKKTEMELFARSEKNKNKIKNKKPGESGAENRGGGMGGWGWGQCEGGKSGQDC